MNSKECPECEARGTFQGSEEFFLTNSEADPRTEATLLTDVVRGFCLPPRVSRFSSRHAYLQKSQDLNTLQLRFQNNYTKKLGFIILFYSLKDRNVPRASPSGHSSEFIVLLGSLEFFLTNSSADLRTSSTLLTDVVLGSRLPPRVSRFSSHHSQTTRRRDSHLVSM